MSNVTISVVIKAKNEAEQLRAAIESLGDFPTEVIVITDPDDYPTIDAARAAGARVLHAVCTDGIIDRLDVVGMDAATGDWILRMDADERMKSTLLEQFYAAAKSGEYDGVGFARQQYLFGGWVRYGNFFQNTIVRFFRRDRWDRSCEPTYDWEPPILGRVLYLPLDERYASIHLNYDRVDQYVSRTLLKRARDYAAHLYAQGRRPSAVRMVWQPVKRFLGRYFIRMGFRDGVRGLVAVGLLAINDFCLEANLWDIHRIASKAGK